MRALAVVSLLVVMLGVLPSRGHGAYPLVVDDAGVHPVGETEWDVSADGLRTRESDLLEANVALAVGVVRKVEASLGFGYGWIRDRGVANGCTRDGVLDLTVGLKTLLYGESGPFTFTVSGTVKVPTASERLGLGTGHTDLSVLAIASRNWEKVSVDLNCGYTWTAVGDRAERDGDVCFAGMALRWQATDWLMMFAETFADLPVDGRAKLMAVVRGGYQVQLRKGVSVSGVIGTGYGPGAVEGVGSLGVTIVY